MDTAIGAAKWVLEKALAPVTDGLLEAWAASADLDRNIDDLKMELLYAHGMLENAQGRGIRGVALKELLRKLQQLAYGADDALDELEYYRIQDTLKGTYHATDMNDVGSIQGLRINVEHTARHVTSKLKCLPCLGAASRGGDQEIDPGDHIDSDGRKGCLSGIRLRGRRGIGTSPPTATNMAGAKKVEGRCMPRVISSARNAANTFGKHFPCYSSISVHGDGAQATMSECASERDCGIETSENRFDRVQMSKTMVEIVVQLKEVCAKVSIILSLDLLGSSRTQEIAINRSKTTPEIIEPKLYGRDKQKKEFVNGINSHDDCPEQLNYCPEQLNVIPIFGPGGIGKTTFTQHICQEVNSSFRASIWICVSLDFSADRLAQEIANKIDRVDGEKDNDSAEELIKKRLKAKRFLLVLDDVWTYQEDEWKKLIAPFEKVESKGNLIIVTTRIPKVAEMVKTNNHKIELESLDDADTMRFFEACVFGNELEPWAEHPAALRETGHEIVRRLKGSPLATKSVGRLLRNQLTLDHWKRILESKEWELETSESDIMPALKLSYDFLPFHLKQLFVYCALFPEDYEFDSKELVQLWIGLGILHPSDQNKRLEDVGLSHLRELVNYGFFKKDKKKDGRYCYVIHDVLHELATKVSSYEYVSICSSNVRSIHISPSVRHLSIIVDDKDVSDRMTFDDYKKDLSALGKRLKVENLRTLMLFGRHHGSFVKTFGDLFRKANSLRTIFISGASYSMEDILHNFSKNIHGVEQLNYCPEQLNVIPIFGPGGIGKTTFTQHICQEVNSSFRASIWICVSLDFSADRLAQEIANKIDRVDGEKDNDSAEELIKKRLKAKRFLLVLDDVWAYQEDEWEKLMAPFRKVESKGNLIIVTTRIPKVAEMVKTNNHKIELESLDDADTMRFFEACVFGNELEPWGEHPAALRETGHEIVRRLKGSPLATKTVGRLLRNQLTLDHWKRVLESKEWELETSESDIMPALKLSYDFLPFHLKQLFVYCALFPEDYEFDSKELVQLWIGLGILHPCDQNRRIEDVGLDHLRELVNYGFFKKAKEKDGRNCYVIHDLLHELATKVSSYDCVSICSSNVRSIHISPSVRHLSIIVDDKDVNDRMTFDDYTKDLSALDKRLKVENLRTLMLFGRYHGSFARTFCDLFREAKALRTIFLSGVSYSMEDILPNFSETIHLRYLRLEPSPNTCNLDLPGMLFRFYHLEVINLEKWNGPVSIRHMTNLVKLHHFLVPENKPQVHSDISEVGKLKLFLELRRFEVGKENNGFELSQLAQLTELGGSLGICNLEKAQEKTGVNEIRPIHRNHLRELMLEWDMERSNRNPTREENVLENLVPQSDLRDLCIRGHGGTNCPTWLGENLLVKNLESLHLDDVSWKTFPPLGEFLLADEPHDECKSCITSPSFQKNILGKKGFQNLKKLMFVNIPKLTKWAGIKICGFLFHLEVLIIEGCPNLEELPFSCSACSQQEQGGGNMTWFPRLRELRILGCPNLRTMPPIPWTSTLCSIEIEGTGSTFEKLTYSQGMYRKPGLSLEIRAADGTSSLFWNELAFCNLSALKRLYLSNCPPLPLDIIQMLTSLEYLLISGRSSIVLSPMGGNKGHVKYQVPVEELSISESSASGKELTQLLSHFPKLTSLYIYNCKNIRELGASEQQQKKEDHSSGVTRSVLSSLASMHEWLVGAFPKFMPAYQLGVSDQQSGSQLQHSNEESEIVATAEGGLLLLPTQLKELILGSCHELRIVPYLGGDNSEAAGGLQRLHSLRELRASDCPNLLSSYSGSSSCFPFPTTLEKLELSNLEELNLALTNLSNLEELNLTNMGDITNLSISRSSKLHTLFIRFSPGVLSVSICSLLSTSLTKLLFHGSQEVEPIPRDALLLLTSLQELSFYSCDKLEFLPAVLHRLASINYLCIGECKSLQLLPKDALPSSLHRLTIFNCPMKSLPKDGLPSSLQQLQISCCSNLESLHTFLDGFPTCLQKLVIRDCRALNSLPKDALPSSLKELEIRKCPQLKSLPEDGLPKSLRLLNVLVDNSEELKRQCRRLTGTIPVIMA